MWARITARFSAARARICEVIASADSAEGVLMVVMM